MRRNDATKLVRRNDKATHVRRNDATTVLHLRRVIRI